MSFGLAAVVVASTALKAYSDYKANKKQAQAEETNAAFLEKQAEYSLLNAKRRVQAIRKEAEQLYGRFAPQTAASGFDFGSSEMQLLEQSMESTGRQIMDIMNEGEREANLLRLKAKAGYSAAKDLRSASKWGAATTLLTGGAQAYSAASS